MSLVARAGPLLARFCIDMQVADQATWKIQE